MIANSASSKTLKTIIRQIWTFASLGQKAASNCNVQRLGVILSLFVGNFALACVTCKCDTNEPLASMNTTPNGHLQIAPIWLRKEQIAAFVAPARNTQQAGQVVAVETRAECIGGRSVAIQVQVGEWHLQRANEFVCCVSPNGRICVALASRMTDVERSAFSGFACCQVAHANALPRRQTNCNRDQIHC